jgi:serine O-acetyltransferase
MSASSSITSTLRKAKHDEITSVLNKAIQSLSVTDADNYEYILQHDRPLPSTEKLREVAELIRTLVFPGYFGDSTLRHSTLPYFVGGNLEQLFELLSEQIYNGISLEHKNETPAAIRDIAIDKTLLFISQLADIRRVLATDVKATFDGDPAAKNFGEIIFCYPTIRALINYRVAHQLLKLEVPLIPRIISELAHSETGIDIHPGASIGEYFCIDHGTGVVIGETCIIGHHVKLFQGVTLGARKFTLDANGNPLKDEPRHPIIEDHVTIYSNATILGRITIGQNSVIGGNVWLTKSIPSNSKIQQKASENSFHDGLGI